MKTLSALLLAALVTMTACGAKKDAATPTGPAAPTDPAPPADPAKAAPAAGGSMTVDEAGERVTAFMDKIATAVTSASGDCAKMGASLKALTGDLQALMEAGKAFDSDEAKKKEFDEKYGPKLMQQMETWMPAALECKDDPEVKAFFSAME